MKRSLILPVLSLVAVSQANAQFARPVTPAQDAPKLIVAPFQRDDRDSSLSLLVADGLRDRLRSRHLADFNTISREAVNTVLRESDYRVDAPLASTEVRVLAQVINARYVVEGSLVRRGADSVVVIARLTERTGANPQSVSVAIVQEAARIASSLGAELATRLAVGFRSFADVEECRRQLDQRNYERALRKAADALQDYASSAAAHLCIADVMQALGASVDSVNAALNRAHSADTLNVVAMRRLASRYEAAGDTANLITMLQRLLSVDTRDVALRVSAVQLLVRVHRLPEAVRLIDEGLAHHPGSADLLSLRMIAYGATQTWDSAAATGEIVAGMDSMRADSQFVYRMTNYFRQARDTTGWLRWLDIGTRRVPAQMDYWYQLASVRMVRGDTAGALDASGQLLARLPAGSDTVPTLRSLGGKARFVIATIQSVRGQHDSAIATARLALQADSTLGSSLAGVYLRAGQRSMTDSAWAAAADHFAQARALSSGRNVILAAYYQGVSRFQQGRLLDTQAEAGRSCETARQAAPVWDEAEQAIIAGAAQNRDQASQLLQYISQFKERTAGMIRNYCRQN